MRLSCHLELGRLLCEATDGARLRHPASGPKSRAMSAASLVISEAYAGLQAQALGLAEAAGLTPDLHVLAPRAPWRLVPARLWPAPLAAVGLNGATPGLVIGCGGMAAAVGAALRGEGRRVVQVQHPRMNPRRFDLVIANPHDRLAGSNVLIAAPPCTARRPRGCARPPLSGERGSRTCRGRWSRCWSAAAMAAIASAGPRRPGWAGSSPR